MTVAVAEGRISECTAEISGGLQRGSIRQPAIISTSGHLRPLSKLEASDRAPPRYNRAEARNYRTGDPLKDGGAHLLLAGLGGVANALCCIRGFYLQRLFSTFPNGWPGIGILLQRVLTATTLFCYGSAHLRHASQFASIVPQVPHMFAAVAGILLLVGLWTPIAGTIITIAEL